MWLWITENAKTIGAIVGCLTACGSGYVYMDLPVPASRGYVLAQYETTQQQTRGIKADVIDGRLQTNAIERRLLRKEKLDRSLELEKVQEPHVRSILQQRMQQIEDDIDTNTKERSVLEQERMNSRR